MSSFKSLLYMIALAHSLNAHAATAACPWFTQGSAEKLLGGTVTSIITVTSDTVGSCTFTHVQKNSSEQISIYVQRSPLHQCPANSEKQKGIGNEAIECVIMQSKYDRIEELNSRVRDQLFTVIVNVKGQSRTMLQTETIQDTIHQIAEQVAGNLF